MNNKNIFLAFLMLAVLSACSSRYTTPDSAYNPDNTAQYLPVYASKTVDIDVQKLLLTRGLVTDQFNRIVPADFDECNVDLFWQYSERLPSSIQFDLQHFYKGIEFTVINKQQRFQLLMPKRSPNSDNERVVPAFDTLIDTIGFSRKETVFRFDLVSISSNKALIDFLSKVTQTTGQRELEFIISKQQFKKLPVTVFNSNKFLLHNENRTSTVTNTLDFVSGNNSSLSFISNTTFNANAASIVIAEDINALTISDNVLDACRSVSDGFLGRAMTRSSKSDALTENDMIKYLPNDADFSDLLLQKKLLAIQQYKNFYGEEITLAKSKRVKHSDINECDNVDKNSEDFRACSDINHKAKTNSNRDVIILGNRTKNVK